MGKSTKNSATKNAAAPTKPSNKGKRGADDTIRNDNLKKRKTRKTFIKEKDDQYMDEQELKENSCVVDTDQVKASAEINPLDSIPRLGDENGGARKDANEPKETPATDNGHIDESENDHPKEEIDDREPKTKESKVALSGALILVESHSKASKEDDGSKVASTEEEPSKMQVVEESVTIPEQNNSSEEISSEEDIAASSDETESVTIPEENNSSEEISSEEDIAASSDEAETEMDIARKELQGGSKILFVGNISCTVKQADVKDFFKVAGDIVGVRLAMGSDRSFRGFAHVEFTTAEGAVKALNELNGAVLAGRPVKLDLAKEKNVQSFQKGGRATRQTIFVCGFNKYDGEVQIGSALRDHFGSCGEITRVSIPRDKYGGIMGMAYIDFKNHDAYNRALGFNGSVFRENTLTVEVADTRDDVFDSSRRGGQQNGGQGSGGKFIVHQRGGRQRRRRFSGHGGQATRGHS